VILVRFLGFAALTCGLALAAEQRPLQKNHSEGPPEILKTSPTTLPGPLSSAIGRILTGEGPARPKLYHSARSTLIARVEKSLAPCAIPLSHKVPADGRFFIREVPVPESATHIDGMPCFQGSVCGEPADSHAH
jgi:hypothetical protein